jgi:uncharacterized protein YbjQ (UPF0145 family)
MIIATTNDLPGYRVDEILGTATGITVRARHVGAQVVAGLKSIVGGELKGLTKQLAQSRDEAVQRLVENAQEMGATAVIAIRFDSDEIGQGYQEIVAYGTAVRVTKLWGDPNRPPRRPGGGRRSRANTAGPGPRVDVAGDHRGAAQLRQPTSPTVGSWHVGADRQAAEDRWRGARPPGPGSAGSGIPPGRGAVEAARHHQEPAHAAGRGDHPPARGGPRERRLHHRRDRHGAGLGPAAGDLGRQACRRRPGIGSGGRHRVGSLPPPADRTRRHTEGGRLRGKRPAADRSQPARLDIQLSGASHANVRVDQTIAAQVSGASCLTYQGTPRSTKRDTSGASTIQQT